MPDTINWIETDRIRIFGGDHIVFYKSVTDGLLKLEFQNTFNPAAAIGSGNYIRLQFKSGEDYYYVVTKSSDPAIETNKIYIRK